MQLELMHDSILDAIGFVVAATGGAKKVGSEMRPEMAVDAAASWLKDCLNPSRRERLTPEQVVFLLQRGRRAGVHAAMDFIAREAGYEIKPVEVEDERAKLQREYIAAVKAQSIIADRLERLVSVQPTLRNVA